MSRHEPIEPGARIPEAQLDRSISTSSSSIRRKTRNTTSFARRRDRGPEVRTPGLRRRTGRVPRRVPVAEAVMRYALHSYHERESPDGPELIKKYVSFGGSVRAAQYLILGAKAKALTEGRYHVAEDIKALAHPVSPPRAHQLSARSRRA